MKNILDTILRPFSRCLAATLIAILPALCPAQTIMEGTTYCLPKTTVDVVLLIEKTTVQPGELCQYAERFMKKSDAPAEPSVTYRLLSTSIVPTAIADTAKQFTARNDGKHNIQKVMVADNGIILAVNAQPKLAAKRQPFVAAAKPVALNAHDYMNQDILAAGSKAKMAELIAQEIYDIRESRSQLSKGQAEFMPKDGEQLRIMMNALDVQETALMQVFTGTNVKDTSEVVLSYVPEKETQGDVLFRFSKHFGLVDADDLSGAPYYIHVTDLHQVPVNQAVAEGKLPKDNAEIYVNLPGRVRIDITHSSKTVASAELMATEFGRCESLDNELFGKKLFTQLVYHPLTGSIESITSDMVKK